MKTLYKAQILKRLYEGEAVTATDFHFSNTNQYFGYLKNDGIKLIETWKPNLHNSGKHYERTLERSPENLQRAKELLTKWGYGRNIA